LTGAGRYAELAAAVRSFKAELIQPSQVERIVEAGSLSETVNLLTNGHVTSADPAELTPVESYLTQHVIEISKKLAAYGPHDSRQLIRLFGASYEYECIKNILKSIGERIDPEEALGHIVPAGKYTTDRCKELIESHNPNRVAETLEDEALKRYLTPKLTGERGTLEAVASVDQYFYHLLWAAANLPDPLDAQSARGLIGESIDHMNVLLAFRARLIGLDARSTSDMMIPVNYALGQAFSEMAEATNPQNIIRVLDKTPYGHAAQASGLDDGGTNVEKALNRRHASSCLNAFAGSPFNVGLALAFLFLKGYELRDLFSIINGKANNVPTERILGSLILRRG